MWSSIQVFLSQVSKNSFYTLEDIDLRESHAELHKKPSKLTKLHKKLWEQIEFTG